MSVDLHVLGLDQIQEELTMEDPDNGEHATIADVVSAISGRVPTKWADALGELSAQRCSIENGLASGDLGRVYGFNTYLGQYDRFNRTTSEQDLLESHLVGDRCKIGRREFELLMAVKACQFSHGSSGVHPSVYEFLLKSLNSGIPDAQYIGAWSASYGSGDVVPGAWFANCLRDLGCSIDAPGTTISLINGNFVSTAVSLCAASQFISYLEDALVLLSSLAYISPANYIDQVDNSLTSLFPSAVRSPIQLPVSLRDVRPLVSLISRTIPAFFVAVDAAMKAPSGNPIFTFNAEGGCADSISQSSFLNLNVSSGIGSLADLLSFCMSYVNGAIHYFEKMNLMSEPTKEIALGAQLAKISALQCQRASGAQSRIFSLNESEGVEDIADNTLFRSFSLIDSLVFARAQLELFPGSGGDANIRTLAQGSLASLCSLPPTGLARLAEIFRPSVIAFGE